MASMSSSRTQHESYDISSEGEDDLFGDNFVTQPTQPLTNVPSQRPASPPPFVQVQASSPVTRIQTSSPIAPPSSTTSNTYNGHRTQPLQRGQLNGGLLANSLAPPGTKYQPPAWHSSQSQSQFPTAQARARSQTVDFSDDECAGVANSSDDDTSRARTSGFGSSNLKINGQPLTKPLPASGGGHARKTSRDQLQQASSLLQSAMNRGGVPPSRLTNPTAQPSLQSGFSQFMYHAMNGTSAPSQAVPQKRTADAMASAYATSRPNRPIKVPRNDGTVSPSAPQDDTKIGDIGYQCQKPVQNIVDITGCTVRQAFQAFIVHKHNEMDAMSAIMEAKETEARKKEAIDLTSDGPEAKPDQGPVRSYKAPGSKPTFKRDTANTKSITQKWSSTATATARPTENPQPAPHAVMIPSPPPVVATSPKPVRRRLVQGRRAPSSPVLISSPVQAPAKVEVVPQRRPKVIDSDDEGIEIPDDDDDDDSENEVPSHGNLELEDKLLQFINTCSNLDLIDVSSQPLEIVDLVLSKRPFQTLNAVRRVTQEITTTTKTGKISVKQKEVGDRLVDICLEMYKGYEAVDELVIECEQLGKPIADELKNWGMSAFGASSQGELSMVDIPEASSSHDSGIGTPVSSVGDFEEVKSKKKLLQQPAVMSKTLVMKDYQVVGLNWLSLLFSKKLSCILADDMGLGKTCQVIAFLSHLYEIGVKGPHLVVVPGSTLENWLREFKMFSPNLQVEPYYGSQSERAEMRVRLGDYINEVNVIVTTYTMATAREDLSFLRRLNFTACVYDEGHMLKNSESKRYQQLMRIPAQFRLLLTGTPLQNNLQELVSLLAFIMPHLFEQRKDDLLYIFKNKAKTDDVAGLLSAQRIKRARSMMTPFILRRKKHQVLKHLPKKTCRVEYCELSDAQRSIYDGELSKVKAALREREEAKKKVDDAKGKAGRKTTKAAAPVKAKVNVLMDLRKAAIHPLLFRRYYTDPILREMAEIYCSENDGKNKQYVYEDMTVMTDIELNKMCSKDDYFSSYILPELAASRTITAPKLLANPENDTDSDTTPMTPFLLSSGKITALLTLLRKHISNSDRTLIFSQFTMVMDVLELVLDDASIPYSRLDGTTPMTVRQDLLDQFHADTTIPVFMLSTKAGGAGINLACANKVVVFDASFNPQEDVQAENRAHRVGQLREVEVVRLVTRGTIEEQIMRLGEMKLALDERVAGEGGPSVDDASGPGKAGEGVAGVVSSAAGCDDAADAAAEKEGMDIVENMLLQGLDEAQPSPQTDLKSEPSPNAEVAPEANVKTEPSPSTKASPKLKLKLNVKRNAGRAKDGDSAAQPQSPTLPSRGKRRTGNGDVKDEYMDGLKMAGLDMSAA